MLLNPIMIQTIKAKEHTLVETLTQWANINSGSYHLKGLNTMAEVLKHYFSSLGAEASEIALPPLEKINGQGEVEHQPMAHLLKWEMRPEAPYRVLLVGHYDTVFSEHHSFQRCTSLGNNRLNGPGVADMKGGLLIMHTALSLFEQSPDKNSIGWTVMLNPDEEIGSQSSSPFLVQAAQEHNVGFVFEPSVDEEGTLASVRKGSGNFHIVCKGKAAHAGRAFHEGKNAVVAASALALKMHQLNGQRAGMTINIGQIDGGGPTNIVPESAVLRVNVRLDQTDDQDWFLVQLEKQIAQIQHEHHIQVKAHGGFTRPPKLLSPRLQTLFDWLEKQGQALGLRIQWQATGGVCDGNNLCAAGLPTIDTLGARGGLIHSDQEFICLDSLSERIQLFTQCLLALAQEKEKP